MKPIINYKQQLMLIVVAILAIIIAFLFLIITSINSSQDKNIATTTKGKMINLAEAPVANKFFYGVDISKWNGDEVTEIDPTDSLSFIICKATEGNKGVDNELRSNWATIKDKKMILGAYHFYHTYGSPEIQASHYWDIVCALGETDMVPIVDIEQESLPKIGSVDIKDIQQDLLTFLELIKQKSGRTPMIYTGYSFANQYLNRSSFAEYPLWLADYNHAVKPSIPNTWRKNGYKIWQKNDNYKIDSQPTDFDVFYGEKSELYE
jgi:lysozyme